ncbi:TraX family protein [Gottschalkiaceae bacterium SANA]|nr:TraX family protein [Gottschalkiaceae bacterium SANA]
MKKRNDMLKIIGMISMVADHVGVQFFSENPAILYYALRIFGRLAFPIFAYLLAMGFQRTRDWKKYAMRLGVFALITQIPFQIFAGHLNVLFTFLVGIFFLKAYEKQEPLGMLAAILIAEFLRMDYAGYGLLIIFIFYRFGEEKQKSFFYIFGLTALYGTLSVLSLGSFEWVVMIQLACVLALPVIWHEFHWRIQLPKWTGYAFYPAHIAILLGIQAWIDKM